jgi:hypothetical protein
MAKVDALTGKTLTKSTTTKPTKVYDAITGTTDTYKASSYAPTNASAKLANNTKIVNANNASENRVYDASLDSNNNVIYTKRDTTNNNNGGGGDISSGVPDTSSADAYASYIAEYKAMVKDYQNQLDKLAEENYKLQVQQNEKSALDQRNQANLNSKMTEKWLNQQYGNEVSGAGISNRLRNRTALGNTIAEINNNLFNNNSTASLNRYNTISNNAKDALSKYQTIDDSYLSYLKKIAL